MINKVTHLGDGLYVKFDGYSVDLMANSHSNPTDRVCFEPRVLGAFIAYVEELLAFIKKTNGESHE
jgi:hypothetical protein